MIRKKLDEIIENKNLDVIYCTSDFTRFWYTNFWSSYGFLFIEKNESTIFLDGRYISDGLKKIDNSKVELIKDNSLNDFIKNKNYKRIGFESEYITHSEFSKLSELFPNSDLIAIDTIQLRNIKSKQEIDNVKMAAKIALKSLESIKPLIKPGVTENYIDINEYDPLILAWKENIKRLKFCVSKSEKELFSSLVEASYE